MNESSEEVVTTERIRTREATEVLELAAGEPQLAGRIRSTVSSSLAAAGGNRRVSRRGTSHDARTIATAFATRRSRIMSGAQDMRGEADRHGPGRSWRATASRSPALVSVHTFSRPARVRCAKPRSRRRRPARLTCHWSVPSLSARSAFAPWTPLLISSSSRSGSEPGSIGAVCAASPTASVRCETAVTTARTPSSRPRSYEPGSVVRATRVRSASSLESSDRAPVRPADDTPRSRPACAMRSATMFPSRLTGSK